MKTQWQKGTLFSFLVACLMFAGCSSTATNTVALEDVDQNQSVEYRLGPGDVLNIFVWEHPDVSLENVPVRPDGQISTPLVTDIDAEGKTPTQLAQDIQTQLGEYIRSPIVSVIVREFNGQFSDQIRVVGEAENPQALAYRDGITLLDVMIEVGGLTQFAAGNKSKIVRNEGGSRHEIPVRLADLMKKGVIDQNANMRPGDVLIIPESLF